MQIGSGFIWEVTNRLAGPRQIIGVRLYWILVFANLGLKILQMEILSKPVEPFDQIVGGTVFADV